MKTPLCSYVFHALSKQYELREIDIGADARLNKGMLHFSVQCFDIANVGHLCFLSMTGMLGLMKMETVVLACTEKDVPLLNLDYVLAMGKKTQIVELYDTLIASDANSIESGFEVIKEKDQDLPDYFGGGRAYSSPLMPCSYAKKTKAKETRPDQSCQKLFDIFLKALEQAPACDRSLKAEKNRAFAQSLLDNGGPAVNQVRKLFGDEIAARLILNHMYGVK